MPQAPHFTVFILLAMSVISLAFILTEKPWSEPGAHKLAIFNESAVYVILLVCLCISAFSDKLNSEAFGYLLIFLVTFMIFVNLSAMLYDSWQFSKLLYEKY